MSKFSSVLVVVRTGLSGTVKILLQLDSLSQYECFEPQFQYVLINIKVVMSIQSF